MCWISSNKTRPDWYDSRFVFGVIRLPTSLSPKRPPSPSPFAPTFHLAAFLDLRVLILHLQYVYIVKSSWISRLRACVCESVWVCVWDLEHIKKDLHLYLTSSHRLSVLLKGTIWWYMNGGIVSVMCRLAVREQWDYVSVRRRWIAQSNWPNSTSDSLGNLASFVYSLWMM